LSKKIHRNSLQPDYMLHWYRIKDILGQGGFGITYLAEDTNLESEVAIKEYLPIELAVRTGDFSVHAVSEDHDKQYKWGLDRFISEARTLHKFNHPNIVRVLTVFEENHTGYMIMPYERGQSLQQKLSGKKTLEESELLKILIPILGGLDIVHQAGFIHRDIKPDNIFIREDGSPVLLDFGSARQALGEATKTLTNLVSPGYAPYEQYYSKSDDQGIWTDIYGLGATLFRAVTGTPPIDAIERSKNLLQNNHDSLVLVSDIAKDRYSERFLNAIDHALKFKSEDRPQSISEWRNEFGVSEVESATIKTSANVDSDFISPASKTVKTLHYESKTQNKIKEEKRAVHTQSTASNSKLVPVLMGIAITASATLVGTYYFGGQLFRNNATKPESTVVKPKKPEPGVVKAIKPKPVVVKPNKPVPVVVKPTEPVPVVAKSNLPEPVVDNPTPIVTSPESDIATILLEASEDFDALRLSSPKGNNALEKYRSVLEIAPDNHEALTGLEAIVSAYISLANIAANDGNYDEALEELQKADKVLPDDYVVNSVRIEIEEKKTSKIIHEPILTSVDEQEIIRISDAAQAGNTASFRKLSEIAFSGNNYAQFYLGRMYHKGEGVAQDYEKARELYEQAEVQGNASAQYNLGLMYINGKGIGQNYDKARVLFEKAVAQENAMAQTNLGLMYAKGQGVGQNYDKARELFEKAVTQGEAAAQTDLGWMYENGWGVRQDYRRARELYEMAAIQGEEQAQYTLGLMYANGQGVDQDYRRAQEFYEKAAVRGNAMAQTNLGLMYAKGQGVRQDYDKAREFFDQAVAQGEASAQTNLGRLYEKGWGVRQDYQRARELYEMAAAQGDQQAVINLKRLR
jgi:TPR repeat protein/serine/threonine protein kinase